MQEVSVCMCRHLQGVVMLSVSIGERVGWEQCKAEGEYIASRIFVV